MPFIQKTQHCGGLPKLEIRRANLFPHEGKFARCPARKFSMVIQLKTANRNLNMKL